MLRILLLIFSLPSLLIAQPELGMWAWKQTHFDTEAARAEMLVFCVREGITHIDQHVSMRMKDGKYVLENTDQLMQLVVEAAEHGISVNALRGDKEMFFEKNHARAMAQLVTIVNFNKTLPKNARLAGIKFDVEPYGSREWKAGGEQRMKVIRDYLTFLEEAKAHLDQVAPNLQLCADVPFWWDKPEFSVEFNGTTQTLVHHVQNLTDWIAIMSYRRKPDDILKIVRQELAYAGTHKLPHSVAPALETSKIEGKERHISFGGVPQETFRASLSDLQRELANEPSVRCIMLHHYGSLKTYLQP